MWAMSLFLLLSGPRSISMVDATGEPLPPNTVIATNEALLTFPWVAGEIERREERKEKPARRAGPPARQATSRPLPAGTPVWLDDGDERSYPPLRHEGRRLRGPPPNTLRWRSGRRVPSGG